MSDEIAPLSPVQLAQQESKARIDAARDKIIEALANLHPQEQLETAQALVNLLNIKNQRAQKLAQLAKLQAELGASA